MTDQAETAEKTHILWATNMDDLGYADVIFLVGEKSPYGVGINCGGLVIVKPLRAWHAMPAEIARLQEAKRRALAVADERAKESNALRQAANRLLAAMDDMHAGGETFTPRVSLAVADMRGAAEQERDGK